MLPASDFQPYTHTSWIREKADYLPSASNEHQKEKNFSSEVRLQRFEPTEPLL
jgi:hypothetical protein